MSWLCFMCVIEGEYIGRVCKRLPWVDPKTVRVSSLAFLAAKCCSFAKLLFCVCVIESHRRKIA